MSSEIAKKYATGWEQLEKDALPRDVLSSSFERRDAGGAGDTPRSRPLQALHGPAADHPVLVAVIEEAQLLGEMGDALAVARLGVGVGEVGAPIAALRAVGVAKSSPTSKSSRPCGDRRTQRTRNTCVFRPFREAPYRQAYRTRLGVAETQPTAALH